MIVKLIVKIDLSTTEDSELIERAVYNWAELALNETPELYHPNGSDRPIGIIDDVEVTVDAR